MNRISAHDLDLDSANAIEHNINALRALFPELVSEGADGVSVDVDALRQLVGEKALNDQIEKFGLNWYGKRLARQLALTPSNGTLRPCPEESVDWQTTQNLMIEGDNLETLKLLQKSFAGSVNLIYIDPPYNTGKDFVYSDDFHDSIKNYLEITGQTNEDGKKLSSNTETSGRFHTDWLNMMLPRLKTSKSLLGRDGVIMISIDDQELANLRLLCNEIFGAENFIACLVWEKGRKNDAKLFSVGHEYLLVYAQSLSYLRERNTRWREEKPGAREIWEKYLELRERHGKADTAIEADLQAWYSKLPQKNPSKKWSRYKRIDKHGPWRDRDISWPGGGGPRYDVIHPKTKEPCKVPERGWIYASPEEMQRQIKLGLVEFRDDHTEPPFRKAHIKPIPDEFDNVELSEDAELDEVELDNDDDELANQVRGSYFYKQSQVSVKALRTLMGAKVFNNPKDVTEIARLIDYTTSSDPEAVVMDFFAGSGTTGHAVWELNARDGGRRRFVLVQLPEPLDPAKKDQETSAKYCDDLDVPRTIAELTKERLRRAARLIQSENPNVVDDLGFRVFKLDTSNIRTWDPDPSEIQTALLNSIENVKPDRSEQDVLYELLLKLGHDLCVPIEERRIAGKTVSVIGGGSLIVCLTAEIDVSGTEELGQGIVQWSEELAPQGETTCVFRDNAFNDDVAKANLVAILEQHGLTNIRSL